MRSWKSCSFSPFRVRIQTSWPTGCCCGSTRFPACLTLRRGAAPRGRSGRNGGPAPEILSRGVERRCRRDRKKSVKRLYSYERSWSTRSRGCGPQPRGDPARAHRCGRPRAVQRHHPRGQRRCCGNLFPRAGASRFQLRRRLRRAGPQSPRGDCLPSRDDLETTRLAPMRSAA